MDYTAEIRIKNKNAEKIRRILDVDKDYREDTTTHYDVKDEQLLVVTSCSNLVSLRKSLQENMKKIKLIEEIVGLIKENE